MDCINYGVLVVDEKEKYDPVGFRDAVISGLDKCSNDFEAISRFLYGAGNKLDYRRYGEVLFDILIAGGMLGKCTLKIKLIRVKYVHIDSASPKENCV